jgi:hypothetical protein
LAFGSFDLVVIIIRITRSIYSPGSDRFSFRLVASLLLLSFRIRLLLTFNLVRDVVRLTSHSSLFIILSITSSNHRSSIRTRTSSLLPASRLAMSYQPTPHHDYRESHRQTSFSSSLPSPPDSDAASASAILPQPQQHFDERLLVSHYMAFTTPVENYHTWATRMTLALSAADLLPHVTHGLHYTLSEPEFLAWVGRDEQAKRMIMSKLGDDALDKMLQTRRKAREILIGTGKRESAYGLWVYLACAYGGMAGNG